MPRTTLFFINKNKCLILCVLTNQPKVVRTIRKYGSLENVPDLCTRFQNALTAQMSHFLTNYKNYENEKTFLSVHDRAFVGYRNERIRAKRSY